MPQRTFANQKALIDYAERNGLAYLWDGTRAFYRRQRLARSAGASPAQVRPSEPPGSECCVRRR
jgi:hypothetical protein